MWSEVLRGIRTNNIWDLAERLLLHVRGCLVFARHNVDWDELERDFELVEDRRDATRAGRYAPAVEFENRHFSRLGRVGWES
jgi:hypothetical protein